MNYERYHKTLDSFVATHPEVKRWTAKAQEFLYEGDYLGLNWRWLDAKLRENEYITVFTSIIGYIKDKLRQTDCSYDYNPQELLQKYRKLLQNELDDIAMYYIQN